MGTGPPYTGAAASQQGAPATSDDLRSLRRWIIVAVVWAIAATAVALIALLDRSGGDAEQRAGDAAGRVADLERTLDRRLERLESRVQTLPQSSDMTRLGDRVARVEDQSAQAAKDAKSASDKLSDLEKRVQTLEDDATSGTPPPDDLSQP